ncbi:MAG: hypothetical protein LBK04_01055 [Clostridiales Family XIII bacterium]|nr:hypothetical protein [Clostridiales Family XIII bacterium]
MTATGGFHGSGIGGGVFGDGGTIAINGGTVIATGGEKGEGTGVDEGGEGIGNGGEGTDSGTFSLKNAIVFADSIGGLDEADKKNALLVIEEDTVFYGSPSAPGTASLDGDYVIPPGKALTIESGQTLSLERGTTLTLERGSTLTLRNGATLVFDTGAIKGEGELIRDEGSQVNERPDPADISLATVGEIGPYTYDGSPHIPNPTVTFAGKTLIKDVDYSVSASDNINRGTASCKITGMGDYYGEKTVDFTINPAPITSVNVKGIAAPVAAAVPDTAAADGGGYTAGSVSWSPDHDKFHTGTAYTATVTLTADDNHTFNLDSSQIDGEEATLDGSGTGSTVTLSRTYAATDAGTATAISVSAQPLRLAYTHGEALDLTGLIVRIDYDDGTNDIVTPGSFAGKGITTSPMSGAILDRSVHDATEITISLPGFAGEHTAQTNALKVDRATQAAPPVFVLKVTAHEDTKTYTVEIPVPPVIGQTPGEYSFDGLAYGISRVITANPGDTITGYVRYSADANHNASDARESASVTLPLLPDEGSDGGDEESGTDGGDGSGGNNDGRPNNSGTGSDGRPNSGIAGGTGDSVADSGTPSVAALPSEDDATGDSEKPTPALDAESEGDGESSLAGGRSVTAPIVIAFASALVALTGAVLILRAIRRRRVRR